ncbi:hypothetical protein PQX77_002349 [Marasmius sp. AFHP31]|nr:hypothetical protein PQX77_002349 [Marasmius sp. AFHP31]
MSQSTPTTAAVTTSLGPVPSRTPGSRREENIGLIAGMAIGLTVLILLLLFFFYSRRRKHNARRSQERASNVMPRPLSLSAQPTEKGSDSKGLAFMPSTTLNTQASNAVSKAGRERTQSPLNSSEIPSDGRSAREYPQPLDHEGGEWLERSGLSSPFIISDFTMDVDNVQVLRAQLTAALHRLAVLEPAEEAPPDYVSSASQ